MYAFAFRFVRPYWKWLIVVVVAILIETAMSLASPWPLKIVLDSVLGQRPMPGWLSWLVIAGTGKQAFLFAAVIATINIAVLQAIGNYLNTYYTSNIGQWVAHDLRQTVYAHLLRLSMSFHDRQQAGPLARLAFSSGESVCARSSLPSKNSIASSA